MGLKFNPITGNFDLAGSGAGGGGAATWREAVATENDLPIPATDGEVRVTLDSDKVWVYDATTSRWIETSLSSAGVGSTPTAGAYTLETNDIGTNRTQRQLVLQPAASGFPGVVSVSGQTFSGTKTFEDGLLSTNIDSPGFNLNIGTGNASTIVIGQSGASITLIGDTFYEQVTNLEVSDKNITLNKGGAAGSAVSAGIEIEEDGNITGYITTNGGRTGWTLVAPATVGLISLIPGDQESYLLGALSGNSSMYLPEGTSTLATIDTAQTFGQKNIPLSTNTVTSVTPNRVAVFAAGTGDLVADTNIDLTELSYLNGVTSAIQTQLDGKANTALSNLAGTAVNVNILPNTDNAITLGSSAKRWASVTATTGAITQMTTATGSGPVTFLNSINLNTTNNIADVNNLTVLGTTTLAAALTGPLKATSGVVSASAINLATEVTGILPVANGGTGQSGDIATTSFSAAANQTNASVTGLAFANASVRSFRAIVVVTTAGALNESFELHGVQRAADWALSVASVGDSSGYTFDINSSGQVLYTSPASTATIRFRAWTVNT